MKIYNLLSLKSKERPSEILLQGGVGNQLFQYFFGRYLVTELKKQVILNASRIESTNLTHPNSSLMSLNLLMPIKAITRISILKHKYSLLVKHQLNFKKLLRINSSRIYTASTIGYDKNIHEIVLSKDYKYFSGYFQSWKYFKPNESEKYTLFEGLTFNDSWIFNNNKIMASTNFTAVHIRLGDFNSSENSFIGVLPPTYYANCVKYLNEHNINQQMYIFSDDIKSAKEIYGEIFPQESIWASSSNNSNPVETLSVMRLANIFIIANSTFSWWAANLSPNNPLVLAPKKWFQNSIDPLDLIPPNWHLVETGWNFNLHEGN
jgi:hypothetical protein